LEKFGKDKINILFLGRIEERKGLIYLLKAYKLLQEKYDNLRLIVVGDGLLKEDAKILLRITTLTKYISRERRVEKLSPATLPPAHLLQPAFSGESFGSSY
jgi:phosphatidylinositol alpha-mannosyltransferase